MGTTTNNRSNRSLLTMGAAALAGALALATPAAAQPFGPQDVEVLPPIDEPEPEVDLEASDFCQPQPAVHYQAHVTGPNRPYTVRIDWEDQDSAASGSVNGDSGFVPSGEGTFELIAVVNYPLVITEDQMLAAISVSSQPVIVTVDCDDPGGPGGPDDPDDNGDRDRDPDIVLATPNFTG